MNAKPLLERIADALGRSRLEAVLIGNAAAALHGAPVTTIDFDFLFRKTRRNLMKLRLFADVLEAVILRPYYPVSDLYRVINDDAGIQVDFMPQVHGVRSFAGLRARAVKVRFAQCDIMVASLPDIIKSKAAAGRDRDRAVLDVLRKTLHEKEIAEKGRPGGKAGGSEKGKRARAD